MSGRSDTCQSKNVLQISWIFQPYAFRAHLLIDSIFSGTRNADQTHARRAGSAHLIQGSWDGLRLKGFKNVKPGPAQHWVYRFELGYCLHFSKLNGLT